MRLRFDWCCGQSLDCDAARADGAAPGAARFLAALGLRANDRHHALVPELVPAVLLRHAYFAPLHTAPVAAGASYAVD